MQELELEHANRAFPFTMIDGSESARRARPGHDPHLLSRAVCRKNVKIVQALLADDGPRPVASNADGNENALAEAIRMLSVEMVNLLMSDVRVDFTARAAQALALAAQQAVFRDCESLFQSFVAMLKALDRHRRRDGRYWAPVSGAVGRAYSDAVSYLPSHRRRASNVESAEWAPALESLMPTPARALQRLAQIRGLFPDLMLRSPERQT